jgi:hypothetical protein
VKRRTIGRLLEIWRYWDNEAELAGDRRDDHLTHLYEMNNCVAYIPRDEEPNGRVTSFYAACARDAGGFYVFGFHWSQLPIGGTPRYDSVHSWSSNWHATHKTEKLWREFNGREPKANHQAGPLGAIASSERFLERVDLWNEWCVNWKERIGFVEPFTSVTRQFHLASSRCHLCYRRAAIAQSALSSQVIEDLVAQGHLRVGSLIHKESIEYDSHPEYDRRSNVPFEVKIGDESFSLWNGRIYFGKPYDECSVSTDALPPEEKEQRWGPWSYRSRTRTKEEREKRKKGNQEYFEQEMAEDFGKELRRAAGLEGDEDE